MVSPVVPYDEMQPQEHPAAPGAQAGSPQCRGGKKGIRGQGCSSTGENAQTPPELHQTQRDQLTPYRCCSDCQTALSASIAPVLCLLPLWWPFPLPRDLFNPIPESKKGRGSCRHQSPVHSCLGITGNSSHRLCGEFLANTTAARCHFSRAE